MWVVLQKNQESYFGDLVQGVLSCTGIHNLKARLPPRDPKSIRAQPYDPIPPVAEQISSKWWLLCFDEFQVTSLNSLKPEFINLIFIGSH